MGVLHKKRSGTVGRDVHVRRIDPGGRVCALSVDQSRGAEQRHVGGVAQRSAGQRWRRERDGGTSESAAVNTQPPAFAPLEFNVEANSADGEAVSQASGHPWEMTTSFGIPLVNGVGEDVYTPVEELKKVSVELPLGFAGDPLATAERCRETQLTAGECPASSEVGSITLVGSIV